MKTRRFPNLERFIAAGTQVVHSHNGISNSPCLSGNASVLVLGKESRAAEVAGVLSDTNAEAKCLALMTLTNKRRLFCDRWTTFRYNKLGRKPLLGFYIHS